MRDDFAWADDRELPSHDPTDFLQAQTRSHPPKVIEQSGNPHFHVLGLNGQTLAVQPARAADILEIAIPALKPPVLMRLAPLQWWEVEFPAKSGCDWNAAINFLIRAGENAGRFNPDNVVGRGVFAISDQIVAHLGDSVRIGKERASLAEATRIGGLAFAEGDPVPLLDLTPLRADEASKLEDVCRRLDWQQPGMGQLLAGWIAIAPLSGILRWRPHVWITGPFESGKSFVLGEIVARTLEGIAIPIAGSATEAGIRQHIGRDAWPVLLDEAEAKDEKSASRLSGVLELMRSAASQDGAKIVKGGAGGRSATFKVRSCFAMASIDAAIVQTADASRIVRLALNGPRDGATTEERAERAKRFAGIKAELLAMERSDFGTRLFWRSFGLSLNIISNAKAFGIALTALTNSGRLADVVAPLLAGWHSLRSDALLSIEEAQQIVEATPWISAAAGRSATERDHDAALRHLVAAQVRTDAGDQRSIGELIETVALRDVGSSTAEGLLARHGLRVEMPDHPGADIGLLVCRGHGALKALFHGTQWSASPQDTLSQHPHAVVTANPVRFGSGIKQRAVRLSLTKVGFFE